MQNLALTSQFSNSGRRGNSSSNTFNSHVLNSDLPPSEDGRVEAIQLFDPKHKKYKNYSYREDSPLGPGGFFEWGIQPGDVYGNPFDPPGGGGTTGGGGYHGGGMGTSTNTPIGDPFRDLYNAGQRISESVMAEVQEAARKWTENKRIDDLIDNIILNGALDKIFDIIRDINSKSKNKNINLEQAIYHLKSLIKTELRNLAANRLKNNLNAEIDLGIGDSKITPTKKGIEGFLQEGLSLDIFKIVLEWVQEDLSGGEFKGYFRLALYDNDGNLLFELYYW